MPSQPSQVHDLPAEIIYGPALPGLADLDAATAATAAAIGNPDATPADVESAAAAEQAAFLAFERHPSGAALLKAGI
jgi:hypothetical protein